ncbi:MAG: DUF2309 domain-containing protein [Rickettsiales bacterium]|nr:DUF2309 domain-containing protein [Rickettsiales bacterium]
MPINSAWNKIAPFWPLQNLIACNPLQGFEDLPIEEALKSGSAFFQQKNLPHQIETINRISIKWCQAFFDEGQASIKMPNRELGFYKSWLSLAVFDEDLHQNISQKIQQIKELPQDKNQAIEFCLKKLNIANNERALFLTLMLTTLSGFSSYVKYLDHAKEDYLAVRLAITLITWPEAKDLLAWHHSIKPDLEQENILRGIEKSEKIYQKSLFLKLEEEAKKTFATQTAAAQFVFCIDVRSEPMRRAIETQGNYETFGFAGFFGLPISIENEISGESYASCPVLLKPSHKVKENSCCPKELSKRKNLNKIKKFYQSLKYNFSTPFALAEAMGIWSAAAMLIRSFAPKFSKNLAKDAQLHTKPDLSSISLEEQTTFAKGVLNAISLNKNFAPVVILCGHGSETKNNTYTSALDCGACGGRHGSSNAKVLAEILNNPKVRQRLEKSEIFIPSTTKFFGAKHNTTTDEIVIYDREASNLAQIKSDLDKAKKQNNQWRAKEMNAKNCQTQSSNWAETRPEWALANNACFIVAPRNLTKNINLEGRSFLHSYDWQQDLEGETLTAILTAPMVVAQWINSQYLFSTIDNVAFGGGSKITQNVVGKFGVMQGNASDLMNGLPLQSVFKNDIEPYHQLLRLTAVINAPSSLIDKVISKNQVLQKLFGNGWVNLCCLDPRNNKTYLLKRDFVWQNFS